MPGSTCHRTPWNDERKERATAQRSTPFKPPNAAIDCLICIRAGLDNYLNSFCASGDQSEPPGRAGNRRGLAAEPTQGAVLAQIRPDLAQLDTFKQPRTIKWSLLHAQNLDWTRLGSDGRQKNGLAWSCGTTESTLNAQECPINTPRSLLQAKGKTLSTWPSLPSKLSAMTVRNQAIAASESLSKTTTSDWTRVASPFCLILFNRNGPIYEGTNTKITARFRFRAILIFAPFFTYF